MELEFPGPGHCRNEKTRAEQRIAPEIPKLQTSLGWRQCYPAFSAMQEPIPDFFKWEKIPYLPRLADQTICLDGRTLKLGLNE